ncbi:MAG: YceI family protein [candidate division Zixibacteria bacterium]|nr:YceI family protein [candidate division Zixibacteria bacterium]
MERLKHSCAWSGYWCYEPGNRRTGEMRVRQITSKFILIAIWGIVPLAAAGAAEYHVDTTAPRMVKFTSKAPLENFDGTTSRIDGYAVTPFDTLRAGTGYDSSKFYFEVDLNALDTGIGLRNRHMRENYLETDRFPFSQFAGRISEAGRAADSAFHLTIAGDMTIHGVQKPKSATIQAAKEGSRYHVRGQFPVALPDYKIKVPRLMFLKISDTVQVQLDFYLLPAAAAKD